MSVQCEIRNGLFWVNFKVAPTKNEVDRFFSDFLELFNDLDVTEGMETVMDLEALRAQDYEFLRLLSKIGVHIKRQTMTPVSAINAQERAKNFVHMQGVDIRFKDAAEIRAKALAHAPNLNMNFINPFLTGTLEVLRSQCQIESRPGRPVVRKGDCELNGDIAGVIGLRSKEFNGSIALCFPEQTFLKVMKSMLGESHKEINRELEERAGVLISMISDQARASLGEKGFGVEKAIPEILRGEKLKNQNVKSVLALVLPFESNFGDFEIEIGSI